MNKTRIMIFDFDSVISDSPEKEEGIKIWEEKTGQKYPYKGWWSKKESLDLNIFDIQPIECIYNMIKSINEDTILILLTSRLQKLEKEVNIIIEKFNLKFDIVSLKYDNLNKGERIRDYINDFRSKGFNIEQVDFYDDMEKHLNDSMFLHEEFPDININLWKVSNDEIISYPNKLFYLQFIDTDVTLPKNELI